MIISDFTLNGVVIKTPQALTVENHLELQEVILLNGKKKCRIKRSYRVAILSFSMLENEYLQTIIAQTLTKAITEGVVNVELGFLGLSGEMETMTAKFGGVSATAVAESIMNNTWSEIDDLVFEEV